MADVPVEAVEFARMAVRAFYPAEYAVIADGILRRNNFCSHSDLARLLCMRPKELRKTLIRMSSARLVKSEKIDQRRINYKDERRPSRVVQTEFWYVPLPELIDAFQYRVDIISRELEERIRAESEQDLYRCQGCGKRYKLVDICANADPESGVFYCDAVRLDRRICNSVISEEDNSSRLKQTEAFKKSFEDELAPLRALAVRCNGLTIPNHPLEGADKETWDLYVPETIGVRGEAVDAEGLTSELAAEVDGANSGGQGIDTSVIAAPIAPTGGDATVIPDRPNWFKDSNANEDDADGDWEENDDAVGNNARSQPAFGTGTMFGAGNVADAQSYMDSYLQSIGGASEVEANKDEAANNDKTLTSAEDEPANGSADYIAGAPSGNGQRSREPSGENLDAPDDGAVNTGVEEGAPAASAVMVAVQGEMHPLEEISEVLAEKMTDDEYRKYCEAREALVGAGDDDDDDVEFE